MDRVFLILTLLQYFLKNLLWHAHWNKQVANTVEDWKTITLKLALCLLVLCKRVRDYAMCLKHIILSYAGKNFRLNNGIKYIMSW